MYKCFELERLTITKNILFCFFQSFPWIVLLFCHRFSIKELDVQGQTGEYTAG